MIQATLPFKVSIIRWKRSRATFLYKTLNSNLHDSSPSYHLALQIEQSTKDMELLSYHSANSLYTGKFGNRLNGRGFDSQRPRLFSVRRRRVSCASRYTKSSIPRAKDHFFLKKNNEQLNSLQNFDSRIMSGTIENYVVGGEEASQDISVRDGSVTKVSIPGLPDESNNEYAAPISSCFWEWRPKFNVHYEKAGSENMDSPAVLFLPGFGVGSFHYEKQMKDLGRDFRVWSVDYLGQGRSLPNEDPTPKSTEDVDHEGKEVIWGFGNETEPWANKLVYSIDLWQEQIQYFVEEVIGEPVYIVGNSLGGFLALYLAACNPKLVKGVTLLNATPFRGFLPNPLRSPWLAKLFPWAGTFPLPANIKNLTELVWQKISDPRSIAEVLKQVYADHSTDVDKVFSRILETTQHPAASASFASIMFAPQGKLSFGDALSRCKMNNVPISLVYGKEDPWVTPIWGLQIKRQVPEAPYYEISPAGHCPHDEVPEVVNYLLRGWIKNLESKGSMVLPLIDEPENTQDNIDKKLEFIRKGTKKSVQVRFIGSEMSLLKSISSFLKSRFSSLRIKAQ